LTNATYFHFENSQQQRMSPCLTKEKIPKYWNTLERWSSSTARKSEVQILR
jgi:hypothetical protein